MIRKWKSWPYANKIWLEGETMMKYDVGSILQELDPGNHMYVKINPLA